MPNETLPESTGPKADARAKTLTSFREIPSYIERPDDAMIREWEAKLSRLYLDHEHAKRLLRRWHDWARAHGHDIGILDDTRAFLSRTP
jgi:hypothetical protein